MRLFIAAIFCYCLHNVVAVANEPVPPSPPTLSDGNQATSNNTTTTTTKTTTTKSTTTTTPPPTTTTTTAKQQIFSTNTSKILLTVQQQTPATTVKTPSESLSTKKTPHIPEFARAEKTPSTTTKKPIVRRKIPNPEDGLRVVIIFLAVVAFLGGMFLTYVFIKKHRRRRQYQQPRRGSSLRTGPAENTQFENPIHFPAAAYGDAVI